jgi:hypothetical protein
MAAQKVNCMSTRPYRLWDSKLKKYVPYRCYKTAHNAHDGIWKVMKWYSDVGRALELQNINDPAKKVIVTYVLRLRGGRFTLTWEE